MKDVKNEEKAREMLELLDKERSKYLKIIRKYDEILLLINCMENIIRGRYKEIKAITPETLSKLTGIEFKCIEKRLINKAMEIANQDKYLESQTEIAF